MFVSNYFKRLLGDNEKIMKKFTLSTRYLKIKMAISLFIFLIIAIILGTVSYFLLSPDNGDFSFDPQSGISIELYSNEIDDSIIYSWLIIFAIYFLIIFPIVWFYHFYFLKVSNQFIFTNQRVLVRHGWLNVKTISIHYNRMTDASVKQDIIDRILKIGTLSLSTAGSEGYKVNLNHIEKPNLRIKDLYNLKENYRQKLYGNKAEEDFQDY
jgi:membrane protein YdbS with pleckstrin-like domain